MQTQFSAHYKVKKKWKENNEREKNYKTDDGKKICFFVFLGVRVYYDDDHNIFVNVLWVFNH